MVDYLKPVQWTDNLSIGVKLVDDEHKLLLSIFNDLVTALRTDQPLSLAKRVVEELAGYATYHFAHEEELMTTFRYPDFEAHHREHDRLTAKLMEIDHNIARGRATITDVIEFARALVSGHFMNTDAKMAAFLRTRMPATYQPFEFALDHGQGVVP